MASISRQAYYQGQKRDKKKQELEELVLNYGIKIRCVHPKMSCKKIYNIIKPELEREKIKYGRDKFIRLMVSRGLEVKIKRR